MFSAPLWLFGLVALAIPLVLHLWSRRPRQVIRVGTLRHVELTADARSWSARLTEPLLLAVRLALLITIVFALAGLRLPVRRSAGSSGSIVLVDPALLKTSGFPFLDSIRREQAPVRLLQPGLPKYQFDGSAAPRVVPSGARELGGSAVALPDLWSGLVEAGEVVGPRGVIHVVASPRLAALTGNRPHLRARIEWHAPDGEPVPFALGQPLGGCEKCPRPAPRAVLVIASDSTADRRIGVALRAIAEELKLEITRATDLESAGAIVTDQPISDSLLASGVPMVPLTPATVASTSVVDSLWAHWPWPINPRDSSDQRLVSLSQVLPAAPGTALAPLGDPEATRRGLILLALLLFCIERWLATRPGRSEA